MYRDPKKISVNRSILFMVVLINIIIVQAGFIYQSNWYLLLLVTIPLFFYKLFLLKGKQQLKK